MPAEFMVDKACCVRCGACVEDCVAGALAMTADGPAMAAPDDCLSCQHCLAVCPRGAVSVLGRKPESAPAAAGLPTPEAFARLARARRSVRVFLPEDVPQETLRSLVETAWHAPTGVNAQGMHFSVVATQKAMDGVRRKVYARLEEVLSRPGREPGPHDGDLRDLAADWREKGNDIIFRGAPHMALACLGPQTLCREADAFIALSYLELAAAAAGVGALWCGFGMIALTVADDPALLASLGVPPDYRLSYVMMLGRAKYAYPRGVDRGPARAAYITAP